MKYCSLPILVFCFFSGYSQEQLHNLSTDNLRGKVAGVKTTNNQTYRNKNNIIEQILINKLINQYDERGSLLSTTDSILYDEISTDKISYIYDKTGKLVQLVVYSNNRPNWKNLYQYHNELVKMENYNVTSNTLNSKSITYYNDKHDVVEVDNYSANGISNTISFKYQYNQANRPISICSHYGNGELIDSVVFKYDKQGRKIQKVDNYNFGTTKNTFFDKGGRIIKTIEIFPKTETKEIWEYVFADFDTKGNWLSCSSKKNSYPNQITTRQITYYQ